MTKANKEGRRKAPILRFKGFTDDWEQRKLLKVCKKEDNKRIPIKEHERKEGNTPYFGANGIQGYIDGYTHDGTNILIAEDGANNVRNYPIKLITGKIWVNNHAHVLKVNTKTNNGNFLVGAIKKINFYRYLVGSSRYKLTAESLNQVKIKIAKQSEQEKIGELLKNIEELLTLYERKTRLLSKLRTFLTQRLFSNSSKVSLYFDNKNWSKHKISEFLTERNEKVIPNPSIPLVSFTVEKGVTPKSKRYNREFLVKDDKKKYKITKKNDIVYNPANLKFGAIARNKFGNAAFSPIYVTFITKLNPVFTEFLVRRKDFIKLALKYQEGTVYERMAVKSKDFLSLKIYLPNSSRDINYIAQILQSLDTLVSLNKNKISLITLIKKELLNTMFI